MSLPNRILCLLLAFMVFMSGLIVSGVIVFEPREDGMGICHERKALVIDGEMIPKNATPEDPAEDAGCSAPSPNFWHQSAEKPLLIIPSSPFVQMITFEPNCIQRFGKVETPPPCA